jgi:hypothetical protein
LTAGASPTYNASDINGNPTVSFDGTDDFLDVAFSALSQPNHIFVVASFDSVKSGGANSILFDSDNSTNRHSLYENGNGSWELVGGGLVTDGSSDRNNHIFNALYNTTNSSFRIDGTSQLSGVDVGSESLDGFTVGDFPDGANHADVQVGEILIYPQDKSSIEADVESYLSDKWGITV